MNHKKQHRIFQLAAEDLRAAISDHPKLGEVLVETARSINASLANDALMTSPTTLDRSGQLLGRLRLFFGLSREAA